MLTFEYTAIQDLVEQHSKALSAANRVWGCGTIADNFAGVIGKFWMLLGKQDRTPGNYSQDPGDGTSGATNETFHPMTRVRKRNDSGYNPASLHGFTYEKQDSDIAWHWVKDGIQPVPEYVIVPEKTMTVAHQKDGIVDYERQGCMSKLLCPEDILWELGHGA
jgi:hypothetical protein